MVEKKVCITNEIGLHARAASKFLNEAVKYKSNIEFIKDNKKYSGKSIISTQRMWAYFKMWWWRWTISTWKIKRINWKRVGLLKHSMKMFLWINSATIV